MPGVNELLSASYLLTQLALTYLGDAADEAAKQGKAFRFDLKQEATKEASKLLDKVIGGSKTDTAKKKAEDQLKDAAKKKLNDLFKRR